MSGWGSSNRTESLEAARQLVQALNSGWRPSPLTVPVHLYPEEFCVFREKVEIFQFMEGEGVYTHKSSWGTGVLGLTLAATTAAGNRRRARKAAREMEARFRKVDDGIMFLTNRRFALQGDLQWTDLWFEGIRMSNCDGEAIELQLANSPPLALRVWPADYHFAMFRWLAYGELVGLSDQQPPGPQFEGPVREQLEAHLASIPDLISDDEEVASAAGALIVTQEEFDQMQADGTLELRTQGKRIIRIRQPPDEL